MVNFLGIKVRSPFGFPSGVVATNADTARLMLKTVPQIGFFISKSITVHPREGNPEDILALPAPGTLQNAVGLANPGLEAMVADMEELAKQSPPDVALIAQIGESSEEGFARCADAFEKTGDAVHALELNLSCPHADKGGILIGAHPESVYGMVAAARSRTKKPIIAKLNAQVPNLAEIARAAVKAGANALSAINTLGGHNPALYNTYGGVSGKPLFPVLLTTLKLLRSSVPVPCIASGGISSATQIRELRNLAELYCIGTALAGLDTEGIRHYFELLEKDLADGTDHAEGILTGDPPMAYEPRIIRKNEKLGRDLNRIIFYGGFRAEPGQFVFVKTDNRHAKPFSVANDDPFEILVKRAGCTSDMLCDAPENTVVQVRGPYGKGLAGVIEKSPGDGGSVTGDGGSSGAAGILYLAGAGCGIAPIHFAARMLNGKKIILTGAKSAADLAYTEELRSYGTLIRAAEDGSADFTGTLPELVASILGGGGYEKPDWVINCGPEGFLFAVDKVEKMYLPGGCIIHIPERMTSCGIGICGKCSTPQGLRLCVDGPGFVSDSFTPGLYTRDKSGAKVRFGPGSGHP